jgi:hypothetical protein
MTTLVLSTFFLAKHYQANPEKNGSMTSRKKTKMKTKRNKREHYFERRREE